MSTEKKNKKNKNNKTILIIKTAAVKYKIVYHSKAADVARPEVNATKQS